MRVRFLYTCESRVAFASCGAHGVSCLRRSVSACEQAVGAGFALTPSPASLRIYPGTSGTTTISPMNLSEFSRNVEFHVTSQLPSGVSALLTSNPDGSSQLTFIAGKDTQPGSIMVTVAGVSGGFTATTTIALSVSKPSYVLSISPIPFTISRGSSFASTVTVVPGETSLERWISPGLSFRPA